MSASAPGVPPLELSVPELVPAAELSLAQEQLAKLKSEHQKLREERDGYAAHTRPSDGHVDAARHERRIATGGVRQGASRRDAQQHEGHQGRHHRAAFCVLPFLVLVGIIAFFGIQLSTQISQVTHPQPIPLV